MFQSSDSTSELLRGHGWESLDVEKPNSPVEYWGLGGVNRARRWAPAPYSSIVHFRKHLGHAHHGAKLISFKHSAFQKHLEREASGIPVQQQGDMVQNLVRGARGQKQRRHMKAGLFDKEDAGMGTHFVTSPDHPQYVTAQEVAAPRERQHQAKSESRTDGYDASKSFEKQARQKTVQAVHASDESTEEQAERPVRAGRGRHDLSESVSAAAAMGTHFLTSPENPAQQPAAHMAAPREETPQYIHVHEASGMGTHFIQSPEHPAEQASPTLIEEEDHTGAMPYAHERDASEMGTHFIQSPENPAEQATTIVHEPRANDPRMTAPDTSTPLASAARVRSEHVHSSDEETGDFGTHFVGSASVFNKRNTHASKDGAWEQHDAVLR